MKRIISISILFLLTLNLFAAKEKVTASTQASNIKLSSAALGKFEARCIGSASTSGRITSIDGYNNDPRILYVGTAGGGVWKTTNGGMSFNAVFDKHCQSIGAVAVDQTNPDIVW